jgi:hypothetical protein
VSGSHEAKFRHGQAHQEAQREEGAVMMKNVDWGMVIALAAGALILVIMLNGCSSLPTMQYCDKVNYTRSGNLIHLEAECRAPIGDTIPGI